MTQEYKLRLFEDGVLGKPFGRMREANGSVDMNRASQVFEPSKCMLYALMSVDVYFDPYRFARA